MTITIVIEKTVINTAGIARSPLIVAGTSAKVLERPPNFLSLLKKYTNCGVLKHLTTGQDQQLNL